MHMHTHACKKNAYMRTSSQQWLQHSVYTNTLTYIHIRPNTLSCSVSHCCACVLHIRNHTYTYIHTCIHIQTLIAVAAPYRTAVLVSCIYEITHTHTYIHTYIHTYTDLDCSSCTVSHCCACVLQPLHKGH